MAERFKINDRVEVTSIFQCGNTIGGSDSAIQSEIDQQYGNDPVFATVVQQELTGTPTAYVPKEYLHGEEPRLAIRFDRRVWSDVVYINESCLDQVKPEVTDEEVEAAIRSIIGQ